MGVRGMLRPAMEYVFLDEDAVELRDETGRAQKMAWSELVEVVIQATSGGPLIDDLNFVLASRDGRRLTVPSQTEGWEALLERLQKLPGFDSRQVVEASSCVENGTFVCWKSPNP